MATSSAARPAIWALSFSPPNSTNSVASGIIATSALAASDPPTGSNTCWYTPSLLLRELPGEKVPTQVSRAARPGALASPGAADHRLDESLDRLDLQAVERLRDARHPGLAAVLVRRADALDHERVRG